MEFYIGQIIMFGGDFAIRSFALCNGQLLAISQNTALFSILGTTYGGDGRTTFALPDLRGRVPINTGGKTDQGPGLSRYTLGERGGTEHRTLNVTQMPSHSHSALGNGGTGTLQVANADGNAAPSSSSFLAQQAGSGLNGLQMYTTASSAKTDVPGVNLTNINVQIGNTGNNQPFDLRQPFLAINFEIVLYGIFPSRS